MHPISEKTLLVTGGAGFIGSSYVRMLLGGQLGEIPKRVYVLDALTYAGSLENLSKYSIHDKLEFVKGDIRNADLVDELLSEVNLVAHFALTHGALNESNWHLFDGRSNAKCFSGHLNLESIALRCDSLQIHFP